MKRLFLALSLAMVPCSTFAADKKSFWPSWLSFKKQSKYFDFGALNKSLFERSKGEKAAITVSVGITAALITAGLFFLQASHLSTTRR